jgi:hypothetical protein
MTTTTDLGTLPPAKLDIPILRVFREESATLRAEPASDGNRYLEGHFSKFDTWFEINSWYEGNFMERTVKGSFKRTFNAWRSSRDPHRIQVLLEHGYDPTVGDKPLGVNEELSEDDIGAAYRARLFVAEYVSQLHPALEAGVYGSSYRFRVVSDKWNYEPGESDHNPKGIPERTITEQAVFEHGPTVFPANPEATAGLRSATDRYYEELRSREPSSYDQLVRRATELRSARLRTPPAGSDAGTGPANSHADDSPIGTRRGPRHAAQLLRRVRVSDLERTT